MALTHICRHIWPDEINKTGCQVCTHSELTAAAFVLQSQQTLKLSHEAAMAKVDELSADLKNERLKRLELEKQLQSASVSRTRMEQVSPSPL